MDGGYERLEGWALGLGRTLIRIIRVIANRQRAFAIGLYNNNKLLIIECLCHARQ